jgi:hypothetical protein
MIVPAGRVRPPGAFPSMQLSPSPDLGASRRRLLLTALVVTLVVWGELAWRAHDVVTSLGDTDDAMRLVMVRDLLHGRGWYDQWIGRLQPPLGVYMHWSRLLDGALAAVAAALGMVMSPARAELVMRFAWPLAWIFPISLCGLAIVRNLGARSAVFIGAILLVLDLTLYVQFRPGRIDHHNIQITMTLAAAACALVQGEARTRWAALAGAASALGLAIGIEALAFHALIGASFALRLLADRKAAAPARAYGLSLALTSLAAFALQTPPGRWLAPFCDAMGANLVSTLAVAGVGLAVTASLAERISATARVALIVLVGLVAAGVYVASDPICLRGPFGAVDPRVRPFWFDHIQELEAWPAMLREHRHEAIHSIVVGVIAALAGLWLAVRAIRDPKRGDWLLAACTLVAVVAQAKAYRMEDYGLWFGTPALAIALADIAERWLKGRMILTAVLAAVLSPNTVTAATVLTLERHAYRAPAGPIDRCYDTASYALLARLPDGLVLSEADLGPFVLAATGDSTLSAPYHRMTWGILAAHDALSAPAAQAEGQVRALHTTYVVDCPAHLLRSPAGGLGDDIRKGRAPSWLQRVSEPGQPLQIYRVAPAAPAQPRS